MIVVARCRLLHSFIFIYAAATAALHLHHQPWLSLSLSRVPSDLLGASLALLQSTRRLPADSLFSVRRGCAVLIVARWRPLSTRPGPRNRSQPNKVSDTIRCVSMTTMGAPASASRLVEPLTRSSGADPKWCSPRRTRQQCEYIYLPPHEICSRLGQERKAPWLEREPGSSGGS